MSTQDDQTTLMGQMSSAMSSAMGYLKTPVLLSSVCMDWCHFGATGACLLALTRGIGPRGCGELSALL